MFTHELNEAGSVASFHKVDPKNYFLDHRAPASVTCVAGGDGIFAARLSSGELIWGSYATFKEKLSTIDLGKYGSEFFNIDAFSLLEDLERRSRAIDIASKLFSSPRIAQAWSKREKRLAVLGLSRPFETADEIFRGYELSSPLPDVSVNKITGLIEQIALQPYDGKADIQAISRELQMRDEELFPIVEVIQHLGFADLVRGDILLTHIARVFADGDLETRRKLFARQLLMHVSLAVHVSITLGEARGRRVPRAHFVSELENHMSDAFAEETLDRVINWGRFGEVFEYDDETQTLNMKVSTA